MNGNRVLTAIVLVMAIGLVCFATYLAGLFEQNGRRFSSAGWRTLVSAVHSRNPTAMSGRPFGADDRRRLLDIIDWSPSSDGQDDLQIVAIAKLVALKDRPAATHLQKALKQQPEVPLGGMYVWAIFNIEGQESVPFLLECFDLGRGPTAERCLRRLSFLDSTHERLRDCPEGPQLRQAFWKSWWQDEIGVTWDIRLSRLMEANGMLVRHSNADVISLRTLVEWLEKHPLPTNDSYAMDRDRVTTEMLISMRVSEILCARTKMYETPWCFPLGAPDRTWRGLNEMTGQESDWRRRLIEAGFEIE